MESAADVMLDHQAMGSTPTPAVSSTRSTANSASVYVDFSNKTEKKKLYFKHPKNCILKLVPDMCSGKKVVWGLPDIDCNASYSGDVWKSEPTRSLEESLRVGDMAHREKKHGEAYFHFSTIIKAAEEHHVLPKMLAFAALQRAQLRCACGDHSGAQHDFELGQRSDPGNPHACRMRALFHLGLQRPSDAKAALLQAVDLAKEDPAYHFLLPELHALLWEADRRELCKNSGGVVGTCEFLFDFRGQDLRWTWDFCIRGARQPQNFAASARMRQFALRYQSPRCQSCPLPYVLTVPANLGRNDRYADSGAPGCAIEDTANNLYPLILSLHSSGMVDLCKGDVEHRQLLYAAEESLLYNLVGRGLPGPWDDYFGLAPCCPPNIHSLDESAYGIQRKDKVYWFKTCEQSSYHKWDFSKARRCLKVEVLVTEWLLYVLQTLPVDPNRIYFVGASSGGYAVLRLAELLSQVPAAVVSMAGYYPDIPEADHDPRVCAERIRHLRLWLMHCKEDKLCRVDSPHVCPLYEVLQQSGLDVHWVEASVARGCTKNYHSAHKSAAKDPAGFFAKLGNWTGSSAGDIQTYLRGRLDELEALRAWAVDHKPEHV